MKGDGAELFTVDMLPLVHEALILPSHVLLWTEVWTTDRSASHRNCESKARVPYGGGLP